MTSLVIGVVVSLALQGTQGQPSIFDAVNTHPTGANGYEEYCRAADLVNNDEFQQLIAAQNKGVPDVSVLQVRQALCEKYFRVFDLVSLGNLKKVYDPRKELGFDTLCPEYSTFREIGKLFAARIYVQMANGYSSGAATSFIDGMKFASNIAQQTLISCLVSYVVHNLLELEMLPHMYAIGLADAARIEAMCDQHLNRETKLISAIRSEQHLVIENLNEVIENSDSFLMLDDEQKKSFNGMNGAQKKELLDEIRPALTNYYDKWIEMLNGPEVDWRYIGPPPLSEFGKLVFEAVTPVFEPVLRREAEDRTRLRLWRLAMRIIQFRWINNRLPNELQELRAPNLTLDPVNGEQFEYKTFENQFELISKGNSTTGPIKIAKPRPQTDGGGGN